MIEKSIDKPMNSGKIKKKLIRIIVTVSLVSLLTFSVCFMAWFSYIFKENIRKAMQIQAAVTAENCSAALAFEDSNEAGNVLSSLKYDSNIVRCVIYDKENELFAQFPKDSKEISNVEKYCYVTNDVKWEGEHLGRVALYASYNQFYHALFYGSIVISFMILLCFGLAYLLGEKMQRMISVPIFRLKDTTHKITESKDFSVRIEKESDDELGDLADAFNEMLSQIQVRDDELQEYSKELEVKVDERTRDLEEAVQEAKKLADQAQVANKAKSEFLANMSHELRTPMNAIIGFTSVLLSEELDEQHKQYMKTIDNSARNLLTLINDILDFSKIEAGRLDVENIPFHTPQLLEEINSEMRPLAFNKSIDLEIDAGKDVPEIMTGDPLRIKQCLINLISNAVKFTEEGAVRLKASFQRDKDKEFITFKVEDSGIGIPEDKLKLIFNSFSQADGSTSRKYGGTGLGLSITSNLVELMGGQITVESQVNHGSTFSITIPTTVIEDPSQNMVKEEYDNDGLEQNNSGVLKGRKILVVEDNLANQDLIETYLKPTGAKFVIADNGLEGIKIWLEDSTFDIILMDMQMPVMNGYDATEQLRSAKCDVPILALTANAMQGDSDKCIRAGCDCHIPKPLDQGYLINVIKKYLKTGRVASRSIK